MLAGVSQAEQNCMHNTDGAVVADSGYASGGNGSHSDTPLFSNALSEIYGGLEDAKRACLVPDLNNFLQG